jgi:hypothetical protein
MNTAKVSITGFMAGALSFLTLILMIYLGLMMVTLFFAIPKAFIEAQASESLPANSSTFELVRESLLGSFQNLLQGLWDARAGYLIGGFLGLTAAWAYQLIWPVRPQRAWLASFIGVVIITSIWFITWANVLKEETSLQLAEFPEIYPWRELLLGSFETTIIVALIFMIAIAYPFWSLWRWWYRLTAGWGLVPQREPELRPDLAVPPSALAEHLDYAAHLHALKRDPITVAEPATAQGEGELQIPATLPWIDIIRQKSIRWLVILLLICLVLLFFSHRYHSQVALRLQHGKVFLEEAGGESHKEYLIQIEPDIQRIRVVNINGAGQVTIYLSPDSDDDQAVAEVRDWSFQWRDDEYLYADVPLTKVKPGQYSLHFVQEAGWGYFEYTISQGGGTQSYIAALVIGFLLACSVILGLALILLGPARNLI